MTGRKKAGNAGEAEEADVVNPEPVPEKRWAIYFEGPPHDLTLDGWTISPNGIRVPEPEPPVVSRGVRLWVVGAIAVLVALLLVAAWRVG